MKNILSLLLLCSIIFGCENKKKYEFDGTTLSAQENGGTYTVSAVHQNVFKVSYTDSITYSDRTHAPVLIDPIPVELSEIEENKLKLSTAEMYAEIYLNPFSISYFDITTGLKLSEEDGYTRDTTTTKWRFSLSEEEHIYGTGFRAIPLNRRGYKFEHFNRPQYGYSYGHESLNYSIPHLTSSSNYMLLFDNPARGQFDIGKTASDILEFSTLGGNMTYYFINGDDNKELLNTYTDLTGKQPLPPIWALGNLQSRFGYRSREETESILNQAIAAGYPVDAVILDLYWFGTELTDGNMGQLDWDLENWPNPEEMIQGFADKGVKTIVVSEPFFTKKSKNFDYLDKNKLLALGPDGNTKTIPEFYFGDAGLLDIYKPEARDWVWNQYDRLKKQGVSGWWVDLGEPEKHPDSLVHETGLALEVHGTYGHEWTKNISEGYAQNYPNERLFKLGRAGFAGTQRYGLIPWTGDVSRSWSGFQSNVPAILSMGLSGLGYMHSDAGGFSMAEKDPELYVRWMQFAAWTAIFRPHGDANTAPPEPALWDSQIQSYVRPSVELRYKLLPYNYTISWENQQTGMPQARPMFLEFENVSDTLFNQYMWGNAFLIAPVLDPGVEKLDVYLPEGNWYNYWTNEVLKGGSFHSQSLTINEIPVYVKAGSLITTTSMMQNTEEYTSENLTISYFLDNQKSTGQTYFDDGKTKEALTKDAYQVIRMEAESNSESIDITLEVTGNGYNGAPGSRTIELMTIGMDKAPSSVTIGGEASEFEWKEDGKTLKVKTTLVNTVIIKVNL